MSQEGTSKDDVKVPEGDLGKQIQADFDEGKDLLVTIISAMGEEQVSSLPSLVDVFGISYVPCMVFTNFFSSRPFPSRKLLRVLKCFTATVRFLSSPRRIQTSNQPVHPDH